MKTMPLNSNQGDGRNLYLTNLIAAIISPGSKIAGIIKAKSILFHSIRDLFDPRITKLGLQNGIKKSEVIDWFNDIALRISDAASNPTQPPHHFDAHGPYLVVDLSHVDFTILNNIDAELYGGEKVSVLAFLTFIIERLGKQNILSLSTLTQGIFKGGL